jgi:short-subunit dehydrogenase
MAETRKVALVTGASSGIGAETATLLRNKGFRVFGTSRRADRRSLSFEELQLDVTSENSVQSAVAEVLGRAGHLDVLVNNAGYGVMGAAEESSIDQIKDMFETNVFGTIRMTRAVLPHMRERKQGRIVNISSVFGFIPAPYMAAYGATKHAVEGFSESLDHEVRSLGVRIVLVEPAFTRTSFDQNMQGADAPIAAYDGGRENMATVLKRLMPAADNPKSVAKTVVKAATADVPKLRYTAGATAGKLSFMRRYLPTRLVDAGIRQQFGLA